MSASASHGPSAAASSSPASRPPSTNSRAPGAPVRARSLRGGTDHAARPRGRRVTSGSARSRPFLATHAAAIRALPGRGRFGGNERMAAACSQTPTAPRSARFARRRSAPTGARASAEMTASRSPTPARARATTPGSGTGIRASPPSPGAISIRPARDSSSDRCSAPSTRTGSSDTRSSGRRRWTGRGGSPTTSPRRAPI